jgi:hypothetical protein
MTTMAKDKAAVALGRKGGKARAKALSPAQRSASAKTAAISRWSAADARKAAKAQWDARAPFRAAKAARARARGAK